MWAKKDQIKPKNNFLVTEAWVSRDPQRSPTKFQSFKVILEYLKLYCRYSSLSSFKYLVDPQRSWFERIIWIVIHLVTISSLIFMVYISCKQFVTSPILTSMDTDNYRTTQLNFPGVAICSINRISRQSAMELATNIFNANITDLSIESILNLVGQLGNHYSSEFKMDEDRNVEIDRLLTTYYNGPYDLTDLMKNLSPQCSMMLLKCKLHGTMRNCSKLFQFRKTQDGFCCTFNYARESDDILVMTDEMKPIRVHKVEDLGVEKGLTIVMEPFLEDYFYRILPVNGWKVIIFDPHDFPDVSSGGVTEVIAMPLCETYIDVSATVFLSTSIIESFPIEKRNCIFPKEILTLYAGTMYTYSDCIVDCKIHDIQNICGCRPFYFPRRGKRENSWRICTNTDLECLAKYKSKWWTVFPHESNEKYFFDNNWALHCQSCYPSCDDISYDALSSKSYMTVGKYKTDLLWDYNVTNQGILHIYFTKHGSIKLKQDVTRYWYELLSDIGGLCGVFIGFSLISVVEMLYFLALALHDIFFKKSDILQEIGQKKNDHEDKIQTIQSTQSPTIQNSTVQTIYWSELLPSSRSWQPVKHGHFPRNKTRY